MIFNMVDKGGGSVSVAPLSVNANGTYTAPAGTAYSPVTVNVSGGEAEEKDVNFYDYDGTRVYSYTKADFLALAAMPSNPDHSGDDIPLTSQGWNWTLANAKTYVTTYGVLEIGQTYVPTDNKTHIVIEIPEKVPDSQLTFYVRYTQTVSQGVTVDWGDGNSETFTGTTATNRSHIYASPGEYDITLNVTSGKVSFVGSSSASIYGSTSNRYNSSRVRHVRIGKDVTSVGNYAFYQCYALRSITISSSVTDMGSNAFYNCNALRSATIPSTATSLNLYNTFYGCYALRSVMIPLTATSIGTSTFDGCRVLATAIIPSTVTSISSSAFAACYALRFVTIPSTVTSIGTSAFQNCYSVAYIRLFPTTPPTLAGTNAFSNVPTSVLFIVPDNSVTTYKGANNWSTYASRIIGESDWNPA